MDVQNAIKIRPVKTVRDRRTFVDVPNAVFAGDKNWVQPLVIERMQHLDPRKNPYFDHAQTALWIAEKDGRAVGRISAQVCDLYRARHQDGVGQFGFLDGHDDPNIFAALTGTAERWLMQRGMRYAQGPYSFSINDETGLLIDGFDTPPFIMMGHARPHYGARLEALGYQKEKDLLAYEYHTDAKMPRAAKAMVDRGRASGEISVRALNKSKLDNDLAVILDIFNDAWADNWGFVPMTDREITELGKNLKFLIQGEFVAIASHDGRPSAMAVTLPNINEAIGDLSGRLWPMGWLKLLWRLKFLTPPSVRLPLMGVRREYHGTPIGAALALSVIDAIRAYHSSRGTHRGELSWILEDNVPMRRMIEMIGGKTHKTYRVYRKPIPGA